MLRYLKLLAVQMRASVLLAVQYRVEFLFEALTILFWSAATFVPLVVVFDHSDAIDGWTLPQSLLVLSFFLLLKSLYEGAINPSLLQVVEHIRKGSLDFVLLKPADAQFLVSTAKFEPAAFIGAGGALALLAFAWEPSGAQLTVSGAASLAMLMTASVALLYSFWILVVSAAFYVVRIDNLGYLLGSVLDFGRWPASIWRGALQIIFTFIIPLALMTTWPAEVLLGRLTLSRGALALVFSTAFAMAARRLWLTALGRYTSASS